MQKVISIKVNSTPDDQNFQEIQYPELNKYLDEGYKVIQVYQLAPSPNLYCFTITFVLELK